MNLIRLTFIFLTALLIIVLLIANAGADAAVRIQKISESALDEMIGARNNMVVISFMAAWCAPCIEELPVLNKLFHKHKDRGLNLVGISIDQEGPQAMQPVIDRLKVGFPVYWYGPSAVQKFSIFAIPMIFFVKDGRIVEKLPGRRSGKELDKKIRKFLAD